MKQLFLTIKHWVSVERTGRAEALECNFANNYYGDQVCTRSK